MLNTLPSFGLVFRRTLAILSTCLIAGLLPRLTAAQRQLPINWTVGSVTPVSVAYSPDGTLIAVGGAGVIQIYNASTGAFVKGIPTLANIQVNSVAFSPDGKTLADGGAAHDSSTNTYYGVIELWSVSTAQLISTIKNASNQWVTSIAYSPDGSTLADAGNINSDPNGSFLELWDLSTGSLKSSLSSVAISLNSVAFSPDGASIVDGGRAVDSTTNLYYGVLEVWNISTGKLKSSLKTTALQGVYSATFSPNGQTIACAGQGRNTATGTTTGVLELWNVSTGTSSGSLKTGITQGQVSSVAFSPDGTKLAASGNSLNGVYSASLQVWNVSSGALIASLNSSANFSLNSVAFSPNGATLADCGQSLSSSGGYGDTLETWSMNTYAGLLSVSTSSGIQLNSIAFSPNGQTLAGGGGIFASGSSGGGFVGGVLNLWNALTGAPVSSLKTAANNVYSVAYSSDGSVLACGGQSTDSAIGTTHGLVELWNLANGTLTATLNTSAVYVYSVAISPDGKSLAVGGGNPGHREGVLEVWSVQSHQLVSSLGTANTVSVNSVAFSPDGSMVAAGGSGYDTATGSVSHAIELWNVASLTLEKTLQTTADVVDSVAFSPDGSLLADGGNAANNSNFGMFELWDLSLGATDATASGIGAPSIVAFSPQANVLFGEGINATNVLNLKTNSFFDTFVPIGTSLALSPDGTLMAIGAAGAGFLYVLPNPYFIDSVSKLSIGASTVIGGNTTTGTITMTGPAGENGAVVTLSSNSSTATVPATITINPGQRTGTFTISTGGVVKQATAVITASANGKTQTGSVTILPAGIASVTVGSSSATGTVTLNGSAGTGGFHVALSSSSALAGVPSSVTVAAGQSSATFHVVEAAVGKTTTVTITAKAGTVAKTTTLTLTPPTLVSLTLDSTSVAGGSASTGTVTLSGVAPAGGISVKLFSSSVSAKIPVTVTVAGGKDSATFKVTTSAVSSQAAATLTAELGATSATASLEILPPSLKSIALSPTQVKGGKSSTATVTISSPAPTGGVVIALTSSLGSVSVPTSIKIPAGKTTGTFTVKTSAVTTQTQANIGASMSGVSKTAVLTIL